MPGDLVGIALWLLAALWWTLAVGRMLDLRKVTGLPALDDADQAAPSVSVVVAARNEERRLEKCVLGLLAQRGVDLEVIVVDDRSTDRTPEILADLARRDPRLRTLRVDELPGGWLGKPHACHVGAVAARGDWILFTDADAWLGEDVVLRSLHAAAHTGADHVCLFPGEASTTFAARAALLGFSMAMLAFAARANRDRERSFIGVGAFNLVRRAAYDAIGGHEALRLEVIDDLRLGWHLRRAGYRSRAFVAPRDVIVQWAATAPGLLHALEKNYFAVFGFSYARIAAAIVGMTAALGGGIVGPLTGRPGGIAAGLGIAALIVPAAIVARRAGWSIAPALLAPVLGGTLLVAAMARSAFRALRRGGIEWRGTFYSLDELRRGHAGPFLG